MLRRNAELLPDGAVRTLPHDVDLHALHRHAPERFPYLLQSTAAQSDLGRFDILFADPAEAIVLNSPGQLEPGAGEFLHTLDTAWRSESANSCPSELPFTGGWFLYLGYELAAEIEPGLKCSPDPDLPVAFARRCRAAIIHDRQKHLFFFVSETQATVTMDDILDEIAAATSPVQEVCGGANVHRVHEEEGAKFTNAVARAKEHIAAGDIYQANLSRAWTATAAEDLDADEIYSALSSVNPAPFAGLVRWGGVTITSSSPERLLRIRDGEVSTRPIAGTRPRSDDTEADDRLSAELIAHPKEIAEHVMLIDLERNDIGRICEPGSVEVDEMMVLESYAHVHHIVSNVRGSLRSGVTPGDAIRAVFPGGTITGCPKVRCMQIINELEDGPRGAYTGSFGYLNRDGSLDLNILIRTMVVNGPSVSFRAGAGIVADSEPRAELEETRAKAKGMLRALLND